MSSKGYISLGQIGQRLSVLANSSRASMSTWFNRWRCSHEDEMVPGTAHRVDRKRPDDYAGRPATVFRCKKCGRTRWIWERRSK
jgi:hypothetical protein